MNEQKQGGALPPATGYATAVDAALAVVESSHDFGAEYVSASKHLGEGVSASLILAREVRRLRAELASMRDGFDPNDKLPDCARTVLASVDGDIAACMFWDKSCGWHFSDREVSKVKTGKVTRWWPIPGKSHNEVAERRP